MSAPVKPSVQPPPWLASKEVVVPAPGWTMRTTTRSAGSIRPGPTVASTSGGVGPAQSVSHVASLEARVPPRASVPESVSPESPPSLSPSVRPPRPTDADAAPPSRRSRSRSIPPDPQVQTLGEALSEARSELLRLQAELAHTSAELEMARRAFVAQADAFEAARDELMSGAERELVRLAMTIARRVVGRELSSDPSLIVIWAREILEGAAFGSGLTVAVAPDVAGRVAQDAWGELAEQVVVDPQLSAGACEVRSGARVADASADGRLAAIAEVLGTDTPVPEPRAGEPAPPGTRSSSEQAA